jgi:hypothetical protein
MRKFTTVIEWNEKEQKWLMKQARTGAFIYDFWDCANFRKFFDADKEKSAKYRIIIEKL